MTVRQFAEDSSVPPSSMYEWLRSRQAPTAKRKRERRKRPPTAIASKTTFAEVSVLGQVATRGPAMTIALRNGDSVTFEGEAVDVARLEAVLKVVRAC